MAIRRFRQKMKPVVWIITILFLGSLIAGYAMSFRRTDEAQRVAYDLNGKEIDGYEVARGINGFVNNYTNYLGEHADRELLTVLAFNETINKQLTLNMAKELKIEVPSSEIKKEYEKVEKQFPDNEQFKRALASQGYTRTTLKKEIEDNLLIQNTLEYLKGNASITPEDIKNYYNENQYTLFVGKTLEEATPQIESSLKEEKGLNEYLMLLARARKNMKLTDVSEQYKQYAPKVEYTLDGFEVTNYDLAKGTINALMVTQGNMEEAKKIAKDGINKQIEIAKVAQSKGIELPKDLPFDYAMTQYQKALLNKLKSEVKYTDKDLEAYFTKNKTKYDILPSANANIAILTIKPSEEDKALAKEKAEKILKEVTPENFAEMAKKYSEGPSAPNGGDLGSFTKGQMVKPFEDAAFTGEVGKVYPKLVETQFGEHIIYIESRDDATGTVKARHILIIPKASKETITKENAKIKDIIGKLEKKEITFTDLTGTDGINFSKEVKNISNTGYIPGLGYNEVLAKAIFNTPIGQVKSINEKDNYFIFDKLSEVEYKAAQFNDVKNRVISDYVNEKAQEEMNKISQ